MCSSDAPPPPAPDPGIRKALKEQAELGREYLNFSKEQFAFSKELQREQQAIAKEVSDTLLGMAKEDRERWQTIFKPLEDEFVAKAKEWDSPERQAQAASTAKADVLSAAETERAARERRDFALGVRPDSGRYAGIDRTIGLGTALASADAQNRARENVRTTGMALQGQAIGLGRNLPGQVGANLSGGLNAATVPIQTHAASTGIVQPGYSGAMSGQQNLATGLNTQYGHELNAWKAQSQLEAANAQGIGQAIGTGIGLLMSPVIGRPAAFLSSKKAKENRKDVPEGEALAAVERMPVQTYEYKPDVGIGGQHVGPMAEDFKRATGTGDGKTIPAQDAIGLALGAIKDLSSKVEEIASAIGLGPHAKRPAVA